MIDGPNRITAEVAEMAASAPEGVSVLVVTGDEGIARMAGPMLARILYPQDRFTDEVLHLEWLGHGFEVVVRVAARRVP